MTEQHTADQALIAKIAERTGLSFSAIAIKAGLSASSITRLMSGAVVGRMKQDTREKLERTFPDVFEQERDEQRSSYVEVPVLPSYAGMGGGGTGDGEEVLALVPRKLVEERLRGVAGDFQLIDVRGNSMSPDFEHGDQLLIDKRDCDPTQPGPFALWDGDGYVVKLVERVPQRRGWYRIFSMNEKYSAYEVEAEQVRIMGRPVWFSRAL